MISYKPILYIMVGIPGSGKSTWAKNFAENEIPIISRDEIRFSILNDEDEYFAKEDKVFEKYCIEITNKLMSGSCVIADATHLNKASRSKLINKINMLFADYRIIFIFMDTWLSTCIERNSFREGRAKVPENVIRNMYSQLIKPSIDEFDNIYEIWNIERSGFYE